MYQYRITYRRDLVSSRQYHLTVIARSADEARAKARIIDPGYVSTIHSPRRGKALVEVAK